jgi:hypothetical protein
MVMKNRKNPENREKKSFFPAEHEKFPLDVENEQFVRV